MATDFQAKRLKAPTLNSSIFTLILKYKLLHKRKKIIDTSIQNQNSEKFVKMTELIPWKLYI